MKDFRAPSIKGFDVLMGPSRSQQSSTQIVNGNVTSTSSITFTYILMANNAGEYTIPGASIVADGDQMVSNSVKIKVLPQDQGGNSGQIIVVVVLYIPHLVQVSLIRTFLLWQVPVKQMCMNRRLLS